MKHVIEIIQNASTYRILRKLGCCKKIEHMLSQF